MEADRIAILKLTFNEWNKLQPRGIFVLDPDGFDRRDPLFHERRYSLDEWLERAMRSTVIMKAGF